MSEERRRIAAGEVSDEEVRGERWRRMRLIESEMEIGLSLECAR